MNVGIAGYGVYIPRYRIKAEDIAAVWGKDAKQIKSGLGIAEKSVPASDEDAATIAVEAARNALKRAEIDPTRIGAVYVGSESHPYTVKPTATIVAEAIEASPELTAADYEFACKAGTAAIQTAMGLVKSEMVEYALAIGSDTAQGAPGDALEFTASAGGAAYLIGSDDLIARIEDTYSYTTDTPDFWRREGQSYPKHGERFTGSPAYFKHVVNATRGLMEKTGHTPTDFDYAVFHQPNGKFPRRAAEMLGFTKAQIKAGMLVEKIGNTYSGSSLMGLASVLDQAKEGDCILLTSFGSGAGSDSFSMVAEKGISKKVPKAPLVKDYISNKKYIDYATYLKLRQKLKV